MKHFYTFFVFATLGVVACDCPDCGTPVNVKLSQMTCLLSYTDASSTTCPLEAGVAFTAPSKTVTIISSYTWTVFFSDPRMQKYLQLSQTSGVGAVSLSLRLTKAFAEAVENGSFSSPDGYIGSISFQTSEGSRELKVYFEGLGTPSAPHPIWTAEDMDRVRLHKDCHFILMADLDLNNWEPIGNIIPEYVSIIESVGASVIHDGWFSGSFNGNGHTIRIHDFAPKGAIMEMGGITMPISTPYGLFGAIGPNGRVQQLTIELHVAEINLDTEPYIVYGGLTATLEAALVSDCKVGGSIRLRSSTNDGSCFVGGFVGEALGIEMSHCLSTVSMNLEGGNSDTVGGLIGAMYEGSGIQVSDSYATGSINITNCLFTGVGGLIGEVSLAFPGGSYTGGNNYVTSCYTSGPISVAGTTIHAGGLVGILSQTSYLGGSSSFFVNNCAAVGGLSLDALNHINIFSAGGLFGGVFMDNGSFTLQHCYAAGDMTLVNAMLLDTHGFGGLVGSVSGDCAVSHSMALQSVISIDAGNNVHRIIGGYTSLPMLEYNYANKDMIVKGSFVAGGTANNTEGANIDPATLTQEWWNAEGFVFQWNSGPWLWNAVQNRPTLR